MITKNFLLDNIKELEDINIYNICIDDIKELENYCKQFIQEKGVKQCLSRMVTKDYAYKDVIILNANKINEELKNEYADEFATCHDVLRRIKYLRGISNGN